MKLESYNLPQDLSPASAFPNETDRTGELGVTFRGSDILDWLEDSALNCWNTRIEEINDR